MRCLHLTLSLPAQSADGCGGDGALGDPSDAGSDLHLQDLPPLRSTRSAVRQTALHGIAQLNSREAESRETGGERQRESSTERNRTSSGSEYSSS